SDRFIFRSKYLWVRLWLPMGRSEELNASLPMGRSAGFRLYNTDPTVGKGQRALRGKQQTEYIIKN
ncbi:hypothetical protein, partial [Leptospira borgpetersenii]|uniref:hypothetical protein n=1 Tax=Leptospira borgpetersenii TaxID=174 RepID=UPI0005183B2B